MGENSKIQWCHHTLNPWIGCAKVSAACKNCYAEVSTPVRVLRARGEETWGAEAARHETRDWVRNLRRWNREAIAAGERRRVFCASLADIFDGHEALPPIRARLWPEIEAASGLDLLLLTKRPANVLGMVPMSWLTRWPAHVWMGTTVEDQASAERRVPELLGIPAALRFLSCEPLLEALDLTPWMPAGKCAWECAGCKRLFSGPWQERCPHCQKEGYWCGSHGGNGRPNGQPIGWAIVGGESGPGARPFDLAWARSLRDQCNAAGVPCFVKQLGAHPVSSSDDDRGHVGDMNSPKLFRLKFRDAHGGDPSEWPEDLNVREFPRVELPHATT
jgi:protein gp37